MASPRLMAKAVATAAKITAGAIRASRSADLPPHPVPDIVGAVLSLVAETISRGNELSDQSRVKEFLATLIERYGTLQGALEALAANRRRHPAISHDRVNAWTAAFESPLSQVEAALKKAPGVSLQVSRWLASQGDNADARLDEYMAWLDGPLEEPRGHGGPDVESAHDRAAEPGTHESATLDEAERILLREKPLIETPITPDARQRTAHQLNALELLRSDRTPTGRAMLAIARASWQEADQAIASLKSHIAPAVLQRLTGDRLYFEGRFDDAIAAYRAARSEWDDLVTRLDLAAALVRSRRIPADAACKEAIDLLTDLAKQQIDDPRDVVHLRAQLGAAWLHYPVGDRDAAVRHAIETLEAALHGLDPAQHRDWWAHIHVELGLAWLALPSGKKLENLQRSITCFERAHTIWTREAEPERWAVIHNHLGHAWDRLPAGDHAANLGRAVTHFAAALEVRTREANPIGWAQLQNNIANVYVQMSGPDHAEHIRRAIELHTTALDVWSSLDRRSEWAATQSNLGNAWALLPAEGDEREKNLRRAIAAYKAALEVRTRAGSPIEWASTQNNMGSALLHLAPGHGGGGGGASSAASLKEAIACFERATEVRSREAFPLDWAKTQTNMGQAWARMPGDREEALKKALSCYDRALTVLKRDQYPHQHDLVAARHAEVKEQLAELRLLRGV